MLEKDRILYEDNHLIIVNKKVGELVQGDETGDKTLADEVKEYLKVTYNKPGNVYLGIPHRLDRPTSYQAQRYVPWIGSKESILGYCR